MDRLKIPKKKQRNGRARSHAWFDAMKREIFRRKPILGEIIHRYGNESLSSYMLRYKENGIPERARERQAQFLKTFEKYAGQALGKTVAGQAVKQLRTHYFASTADHLGPLTHPFFLSSNLAVAASFCDAPDFSHVIVLANGNVSLGNSSFPRGLLYHGQNGALHRVAFSSAAERLRPVLSAPAFSQKDLERIFGEIGGKVQNGTLTKEEGGRLCSFIHGIYGSSGVLKAKTYSTQITKSNRLLWRNLVPGGMPGLVYLELEGLVSSLLIDHHLSRTTAISKILFDKKTRDAADRLFKNVTGSFSDQDGKGTYLFWALPETGKYRVALRRRGDVLVSADGSITVRLVAKDIQKALREKKLIPNLLLSFLVVSLYHGLTCLGGFSQVNYLTDMKERFIRLMAETKDGELATFVETKAFCGDINLAFLETAGTYISATGVDLALRISKESWERFRERACTVTLAEALDPMIPELYTLTVPLPERKKEFANVGTEVAIAASGIRDKLTAWASL